jgi:hypothetical protein
LKTGDRVRGKTTDQKYQGWLDKHPENWEGRPIGYDGPDLSWHEGTLIIRHSSLFGGFTLYELVEDGASLDPDTIEVLEKGPPRRRGETKAQQIQRLLGEA